MKPARLPRLFAAVSIALVIVLFNYPFIRIDIGEFMNGLEPDSRDRQVSYSASATPVKREMANTGPGWAEALALPSPAVLREPARSTHGEVYSPAFKRFIDRVADGQKGVIKGVYVPGIFALQVVQQPDGKWSFVSDQSGIVTEFQSAARNGVTGLLAHNYLSGDLFYKLDVGKEVRIVYGDKKVMYYIIEGIYSYQKLTPSSPQSELIDLATNEKVTTEEVFNRFYRGKHKVTFQTCLEAYGLSNWGLTFTVAVPLDEAE